MKQCIIRPSYYIKQCIIQNNVLHDLVVHETMYYSTQLFFYTKQCILRPSSQQNNVLFHQVVPKTI